MEIINVTMNLHADQKIVQIVHSNALEMDANGHLVQDHLVTTNVQHVSSILMNLTLFIELFQQQTSIQQIDHMDITGLQQVI